MNEKEREAADDWLRGHLPEPEECSLEDDKEDGDTLSYFFLRYRDSALLPADMFSALARHLHGDWDDVDDEDWEANEVALVERARLLSVFMASAGTKFYVITEWDRSLTTILPPSDY